MAATKKPFLLGIAGGSGSGKTTIARNLMSRMPSGSAVLLDHDSYYQDRSHLPPHERELINYDHPDALDNDLLVAHLGELIAGQSVEIPYYDFLTHTRTPQTRTVPSAPVIILEGILLFADERIRRLLDVKIFVETDADVRFLRRARRDIGSRGRTFEQVEEQVLRDGPPDAYQVRRAEQKVGRCLDPRRREQPRGSRPGHVQTALGPAITRRHPAARGERTGDEWVGLGRR